MISSIYAGWGVVTHSGGFAPFFYRDDLWEKFWHMATTPHHPPLACSPLNATKCRWAILMEEGIEGVALVRAQLFADARVEGAA